MKHITIVISILPAFFSCQSNLKSGESNFNPYKKGEILIFESNSGERDTLRINQILQMKNYSAQMKLAPQRLNTLLVEAEYKKYSNNFFEDVETNILEINKFNNEPASVQFNFSTENAEFYPKYHQLIDDILKLTKHKMKVGGKIYNDIVIVKPGSNEYASREHFISKIYWSLKYGYVRYDLLKGESWELVGKISR